MADVLANTDPAHNPLLAPVYIPEDPSGVLKSTHPAAALLSQSALVVQRQIEMLNIFLGFEQANRYVILNPNGEHVGYLAETEGGIASGMKRQLLRTHRPFTAHVFDKHSREVLRFDRPLSVIKSIIRVYDPWDPAASSGTQTATSLTETKTDPLPQQYTSMIPLQDMPVIGETHSKWNAVRRKYDLFLSHNPSTRIGGPKSATEFTQFAGIDEPLLSWAFALRDEQRNMTATVNREFRGFGREIFTDTGSYVLSMDSAKNNVEEDSVRSASQSHGMTLDQRAVMLATAVTIDFDYFSRHSHGGDMWMLPMMAGGGAEAGAGAAGAAGAGEVAAGAAVGTAGRAVGGAAGAGGIGEGAIAGAGTMAGYEAMQRGMGRGSEATMDDASPQAPPPPTEQPYGEPYNPEADANRQQNPGNDQGEDVWGASESDPWSEGAQGSGEAGGGDGGGLLSSLWNSFWED
jgi:hypothetical protein